MFDIRFKNILKRPLIMRLELLVEKELTLSFFPKLTLI